MARRTILRSTRSRPASKVTLLCNTFLSIAAVYRSDIVRCSRVCEGAVLAGLCLADAPEPRDPRGGDWGRIMPTFSPELIQTMRAALEEAMTKVPLEQATPGIKAHLAECILNAAAEGQTSYESLMAAAADQLSTILSTFT
jgi:hypothetical protein